MSTAPAMNVAPSGPNAKPGNHIVLPGQLPKGEPILSVLVKRSYRIIEGKLAERSDEDRPMVPGDVPWETPLNSSVRFESDFVPYKLSTDVVLNGHAYSPKQQPCQKLIVGLKVGDVRKEVYVVGDRNVIYVSGSDPKFSDPEPFTKMELKYERAYGGIDVFSDSKNSYAYGRNPVGRGFVVKNAKECLDRLKLPNLEDPKDRLTPERLCVGDFQQGWTKQPVPCSLGWYPKTWLPRAAFAGVMPGDRKFEQEMRSVYAKLIPAEHQAAYQKTNLPDMDFRFFNGASIGLSVPYLHGGETVVADFLTEEPRFQFQLPKERPTISIDIGEGAQEPSVALHTVMIHMDQRQLDLVWRGAIEYPGMDWLPQMKKMEVIIR